MSFQKLENKWKAFCAAHKAAATLAVLLLVAALGFALAIWRQNGSAYATGLWDDGSQSLVFGRMLQMQQKQSSPGGFMGVYTEEWGDTQNRYLYRENAAVAPDAYMSYTHQTGLQGAGFALLNKLLTVAEDRGEVREQMLYTVNSALFYMATLAVCLAVWRALGLAPAACWLAAVLFAPWVQRGMKDLYWCLWTWLLPALAALALCAAAKRGQVRGRHYALIFAACMVRCMCGFEFISVFLILCELPLATCWAVEIAERRPAKPWFTRMLGTAGAALGGVAAALAVWLVQGGIYYGNLAESLGNITSAVTSRVSVSDSAVRSVTVGQVLQKYITSADPVLQFGPVGLTVLQLLGIGAAALALAALLLLAWHAPVRCLLPLCCAWALSFAAPVSWMVLSKAHADVHVQLIPMLWHFAFVPMSCALPAALACLLLRQCGKVKR